MILLVSVPEPVLSRQTLFRCAKLPGPELRYDPEVKTVLTLYHAAVTVSIKGIEISGSRSPVS